MSEVELGIGLQGDRPLADYARIGRLAEDLGFAVVSAFGDVGYMPPVPILLEIARVTERVRLGPSCLNPYTTSPVEIASQIATLDAASRGRAYVGLAKGAWLESVGVPQPRPLVALREAATVVDLLLRGGDSGFAGEMFAIEPGFRLRQPLPARRVPLLIGAWGPRTVALAGRMAAELKLGGSANPDLARLTRERLGGASETALVMGAVTVVDEDRRLARERARAAVAMYFDVVGRLDPTVDAGPVLTESLLDRFAFAGTPADVRRQVRDLFDAGVKRVEFGAPFGLDHERGLRLLGEKVVSEFVSPS